MEQKISEKLKHCLGTDGCGKCDYVDEKAIMSCRGLLQSAYEKIKDYENSEEKGLILNIPCKVGTNVYWVNNWFYDGKIGLNKEWHISESKISKYYLDESGFYVKLTNGESISVEDFDKIIFLTKQEAEYVLNRMKREGK